MSRRPSLRALLVFVLVATAGTVATIPGSSAAATCQAWSGPLPAIGDEWSLLSDVAVISPCKAFAVGTYRNAGSERALIERWNGNRWSIVDLPEYGPVHDGLRGVSAVAANDIWAVGSIITSGGEDRPLALHWNGTGWSRVAIPATGDSGFYSVDAIATDDVWAVGQRYIGNVPYPLIEHWNGVRWKVVTPPDTGDIGSSLFGVDAGGPDDVWAVGRYDDGGQSVPLAMRWNGTAWRLKSVPTISAGYHELDDVVTISPSKAWAVGTSSGSPFASILVRWNGSAWKAVAHPEPGSDGTSLTAVEATSATNVWAVGDSCELSGRCDSLVLHFDGDDWVVQPSAISGDGSSLEGIDASSATNAWAVGSTEAPSTSSPFAIHCC